MTYISVKEASKKWGISERRIRILCSEGRVDGVIRSGWAWNIPSTAQKPGDGRKIRHVKNFDLRTGSINFTPLNNIRESLKTMDIEKNDFISYFNSSVNRYLSSIFISENLEPSQVISILEGKVVKELSLNQHLLVTNAKSIIVDFFFETGLANQVNISPKSNPFFSEKRLMSIQNRLFNGIDDFYHSSFRDVDIPFAGAWSQDNRSYSVKVQMETLLVQCDNEWTSINGVVKSAFLFGELLRIKPFEEHSFLFASIILAGSLLDCGYPLSPVSSEDFLELKADLSLTLKRGNYNKIIRLFEKSIQKEYGMIKDLLKS
jgi:hypothetical protein